LFFKKEVEIKENAKKSIKNYYQQHNEFLSELKSAQERFSNDGEQKINLEEEKDLDDRKKCSVQIAIYASFFVNIVLFVFKVMALVYSKSNSILASAVDSFLDLLAGKKKKRIYLLQNKTQKKNIYLLLKKLYFLNFFRNQNSFHIIITNFKSTLFFNFSKFFFFSSKSFLF
jgi:hypothetical protein